MLLLACDLDNAHALWCIFVQICTNNYLLSAAAQNLLLYRYRWATNTL